jgi:hypothetical protein
MHPKQRSLSCATDGLSGAISPLGRNIALRRPASRNCACRDKPAVTRRKDVRLFAMARGRSHRVLARVIGSRVTDLWVAKFPKPYHEASEDEGQPEQADRAVPRHWRAALISIVVEARTPAGTSCLGDIAFLIAARIGFGVNRG